MSKLIGLTKSRIFLETKRRTSAATNSSSRSLTTTMTTPLEAQDFPFPATSNLRRSSSQIITASITLETDNDRIEKCRGSRGDKNITKEASINSTTRREALAKLTKRGINEGRSKSSTPSLNLSSPLAV